MSLDAMVTAARDGKITDFEQAFHSVVSQRVAQRIEDVKNELGHAKPDGDTRGED